MTRWPYLSKIAVELPSIPSSTRSLNDPNEGASSLLCRCFFVRITCIHLTSGDNNLCPVLAAIIWGIGQLLIYGGHHC